jgi:hypothetical protein
MTASATAIDLGRLSRAVHLDVERAGLGCYRGTGRSRMHHAVGGSVSHTQGEGWSNLYSLALSNRAVVRQT